MNGRTRSHYNDSFSYGDGHSLRLTGGSGSLGGRSTRTRAPAGSAPTPWKEVQWLPTPIGLRTVRWASRSGSNRHSRSPTCTCLPPYVYSDDTLCRSSETSRSAPPRRVY